MLYNCFIESNCSDCSLPITPELKNGRRVSCEIVKDGNELRELSSKFLNLIFLFWNFIIEKAIFCFNKAHLNVTKVTSFREEWENELLKPVMEPCPFLYNATVYIDRINSTLINFYKTIENFVFFFHLSYRVIIWFILSINWSMNFYSNLVF